MTHITIERDGTHTEKWGRQIIRNARRGFYHDGVPRWKKQTVRIKPRVMSEQEAKNIARRYGG